MIHEKNNNEVLSMKNNVLFIDDEINVLKSILRAFSNEKINVRLASNPQDAFDIIRNEKIAVVVSDNMMPGITGIDLLSQIRERFPDTIRIMMSGYTDPNTTLDAINFGGVYKFIVKPWNNEDLVSIVKDALVCHKHIPRIPESEPGEPSQPHPDHENDNKDGYVSEWELFRVGNR